ncbi:EutN/CcmL family microcompartment protein [Niameybacter massiliensis]|uniref:EutN/CcmL family microcompartment protein n=1 Tax=Holtiella tumoricola TaxID=3018743 RepID=A0AA42DQF3_9FIRM|nr:MULTISPECIES: EutN/CcmL family microcompartment protein [Lachnospirales]MDA3733061.1 EutN/CcmL family microcompartment protein [Holtiella tumoricola]
MDVGRVIGNVWATKKDENLNGQKLLAIKILLDKEHERDGFVVASDIVGAGVGDLVLISHGGGARHAVGNSKAPIDSAVVGIVDSIEVLDYE